MLALEFLLLFSSLMSVWLIVAEGQVCMYYILYCIVHFTSFCVYVHRLAKYGVCLNSDLYMYIYKCFVLTFL